MPDNIFILTKVEVHAPVPGIYEYANNKIKGATESAGMCYHLMNINLAHSALLPCCGSFVNLWNWLHL